MANKGRAINKLNTAQSYLLMRYLEDNPAVPGESFLDIAARAQTALAEKVAINVSRDHVAERYRQMGWELAKANDPDLTIASLEARIAALESQVQTLMLARTLTAPAGTNGLFARLGD